MVLLICICGCTNCRLHFRLDATQQTKGQFFNIFLLATTLFIYAFYRKVNINAQPLQTIDKILICTTVLSIITILLWRYLSKVALQCFIVLNVLVNVIFINYFYSDFALSKHFNQAGVTKESLHGRS